MATALFAEHAKSRVAIFYKGSVFSGYRSKGCLLVIFFELAHLTCYVMLPHIDKFLSFLQIFDEASLETIRREREMDACNTLQTLGTSLGNTIRKQYSSELHC